MFLFSTDGAAAFAAGAHGALDQRRKYTGEPYFEHCKRVAEIVWGATHNAIMMRTAYLHDVVEDTAVTLQDIERHFGPTVSCLVAALTNAPKSAGTKAERDWMDIARLSVAPAQAQTIKLADIIDNASTIWDHDPEYAKLYTAKKRDILAVMDKGDSVLYAKAKELCR